MVRPPAMVAERFRGLMRAAAFGLAYFLAAQVGTALHLKPYGIAIAWPAAGVAVAAFAASSPRRWPSLALGLCIGNIVANLDVGMPLTDAAGVTIADLLEAIGGAMLIQRLAPRPIDMGDFRHVIGLCAVAAVVSPVTALLGALASPSSPGVPFFAAWRLFWISDAVGIVIVTPIVLTSLYRLKPWVRSLSRLAQAEAVLVLVAVTLVAWTLVAVDLRAPAPIWSGKYLIFPFLIWGALRHGPVGAALTTTALAVAAIASAIHSTHLMRVEEATDAVLALQVFLCVAIIPTLGCAAIDATRRASQAALASANELVTRIIVSSPTAIVALDAARTVTIWNPAAERLLGWRASEIQARSPPMLADRSEGGAAAAFAAALAGRAVADLDLKLTRRDGAQLACLAALAPLKGPSDEVTGAVGMFMDVTARLELEARLRQSQKLEAIGLLAAGVAHDFNNFLTVILASGGRLAHDPALAEPDRKLVATLLQAAQRAAAVTRQLLGFARKQIVHPKVIAVSDAVQSAGELLRRLVREDVDLRFQLAADAGSARVEPAQLDQILMNLVANARDATPAGGRITVATAAVTLAPGAPELPSGAAAGPYVRLSVSDTGSGITDALRSRIFEPFFTTKELGKGTGLGLALVDAVARQSGGFVRVTSEPGHGASFAVYLPAVAAAVEPAATHPPLVSQGQATVLLVEDQDDVREIVAEVLTAAGYTVIAASTPAEALSLGRPVRGGCDLLLTDCVLPGMSGPALADLLRRDQPHLAVLVMSGYMDDEIAGLLDREPAPGLLQKPFDDETLLTAVAAQLQPPAHLGESRG